MLITIITKIIRQVYHQDHQENHQNGNQDHQVEFKCSSSPSNPAAELKWETYDARYNDAHNKRTAQIEVNDNDYTSWLWCMIDHQNEDDVFIT